MGLSRDHGDAGHRRGDPGLTAGGGDDAAGADGAVFGGVGAADVGALARRLKPALKATGAWHTVRADDQSGRAETGC